ncbi:MAG: cobalamin-dependent protein [Patescibacteria group bacterium]
MKKISLFNLPYPFGKRQIYLPSTLIVVGAQLIEAGFEVELIDLNLNSLDEQWVQDKVRAADFIGTSLVGSSNMPDAIQFSNQVYQVNPRATILIGGQVTEGLLPNQFKTLFGDKPIQINNDSTLKKALGVNQLPDVFEIDCVKMYKTISDEALKLYLEQEAGLFVAQGCRFACRFCGAAKSRQERFRSLEKIRTDLQYLAGKAREFGLSKLQFYISSLDLFQSPRLFADFLTIVGDVSEKTGVQIRIRGLSCISSFITAYKTLPNFHELVMKANLFAVGFGFDGTDEKVWRDENKTHNRLSLGDRVLEICREVGITAELLMVFGFPEDNLRTLAKTVWYSVRKSFFCGAVARPYLAKMFIPKNDNWMSVNFAAPVEKTVRHPSFFYNLDFAALGSPLTHPRRWHRWASNLAYLTIIILLTPFGKNTTFPLLPQGGKRPRWRQKLIEWINRKMPFDR